MDKTVLHVDRGNATKQELQETLDEILSEITTGEGELAEEARAIGIAVDTTPEISVSEDGQGFEPLSTLAVVFVGAVGKELAKRFWVEVIRPEIRRRRGADAVGDLDDG